MVSTGFQDMIDKKELIGKLVINILEKNNWNENFIRNLDDYAPTLSYLGHGDFVTKKVENLISNSEFISHGLYSRDLNNIFVSWKNDEWLGGLIYLDNNFFSEKISTALDSFLESFSNAFLKNDKICSFSFFINGKWHPYPSFSPRCGVIIEELSKLDKRYQKLNWEILLKKSFENEYFEKKGIFPNETFFGNLSFFNNISDIFNISVPGYYIKKMTPGRKIYTPAKENSSLLHALITGCKTSDSSFLHSKLNDFTEGYVKNFITQDGFVGTPPLETKSGKFSLSINHPIIDAFCDAYYFVKKNQKWLDLAEKLANSWEEIRFPTNLFPKSKNQDFSWLDDQIDIAISFGRLYELTGKERYLDVAKTTIKSTFDKHYIESKQGLVEKVGRDGKVIDSSIHPKYNALAIKAFIFIEEVIEGNKKIYSDDSEIHEILKDR